MERYAELQWAVAALMAGDELGDDDIPWLQAAADNGALTEEELKAWHFYWVGQTIAGLVDTF